MGRDKRKNKNPVGGGKFTNAKDLENRFFANSEERRKARDKEHGDADYWTGGKCNWGGKHYLQKDCETLAEFFNTTASVADDVNEIKLSANETIFNQKKQALVSKIQGLTNQCKVSDAWSIAYVCCIWNDYFGKFLKPFLNTFSTKLQRQLGDVQKLEPKHQKELLQLEQEARELQSAYDENVRKANDPNTSPEDKTKFLILANQISEKAKRLKSRIKQNPLSDLSRFSNLDDLTALLGGKIPKKPPSSSGGSGGGGGGGSIPTPNPLEDPKSFFEQNQTVIFITLALIAILFLFYSQNSKEENEDNSKEEKKFMRQMMLMRMMNNNSPSDKTTDLNSNEDK